MLNVAAISLNRTWRDPHIRKLKFYYCKLLAKAVTFYKIMTVHLEKNKFGSLLQTINKYIWVVLKTIFLKIYLFERESDRGGGRQ